VTPSTPELEEPGRADVTPKKTSPTIPRSEIDRYSKAIAEAYRHIDVGWGSDPETKAAVRQMGEEIYKQAGMEGMLAVHTALVKRLDGRYGRCLEVDWDRVGPWMS
jgi:hypothetical protein